MEKLNIVLALLAMIILPIIGNILYLCIFPLLCLILLFSDDQDFYKQIKNFKNSIATFKTK